MKHSNTLALLIFGSLSTAAFAMDLTPHEIAAHASGPSVKRYFIQDDGKRFAFKIDSKMSVSGSVMEVAFRFEDIASAAMKLSKSPTLPAVAFEEKNLAAYRAAAQALLPPEATGVRLEEELADAIAINGWTSRQYNFSYTVQGIPRRRSVTFLNFNAQSQIVFDIGATAAEYEKAYARGYRVLNSITEHLTDSNTGPT